MEATATMIKRNLLRSPIGITMAIRMPTPHLLVRNSSYSATSRTQSKIQEWKLESSPKASVLSSTSVKIQGERTSRAKFHETQLLHLASADVEDQPNQEPCFDTQDLNLAFLSCCLRKNQSLQTFSSLSSQGSPSVD